MQGYRFIGPKNVLATQTISGVTPVQSSMLNMVSGLSNSAFLIVAGAGLTATFQAMVSFDGVNFFDCGMVFPALSGSAATIPVEGPGSFPYVLIQVTPSAGSGSLTITGHAK